MCVLAFQYKTARDATILVAANREEYYDRPTQVPRIQSGRPRVICGIDRKAGGTWFGVNQHSMFAAVANRFRGPQPEEPRSRGLLCREMLNEASSAAAAEYAAEEMKSGRYASANFLCADMNQAFVVQCGGRLRRDDEVRVIELRPGLHMFSEAGVDDYDDERQEFVRRLLTLQRLDSAVAFLAVSASTFSRMPDAENRRGVMVCGDTWGTVSSSLLSLAKKTHNAVFHYAPVGPGERTWDDLSALLRQVLSTDR